MKSHPTQSYKNWDATDNDEDDADELHGHAFVRILVG